MPTDRTELRRLISAAAALPWRVRRFEGMSSVSVEMSLVDWELATAAVNALPGHLDELDALFAAFKAAIIPLETLCLTEMDSRWMCDDLKNSIVLAVAELRKAAKVIAALRADK